MEGKKSNKIREIVRLKQILKKWKNLAIDNSPSKNVNNNGNKGIQFLKKTLSFSESRPNYTNSVGFKRSASSSACGDHVPKGYLAVCVGKELKRYVIPTHYLSHQEFGILLREAEEEFGFHQEGVLKIPSDVSVFERILRVVEPAGRGSRSRSTRNYDNVVSSSLNGFCSPDSSDRLIQVPSQPQLCT